MLEELVDPYFCSLMFVTLDDTMKNGPKTFVIVTTAVSRNVCFYRPVRSHKIDYIFCTIDLKTLCGRLRILTWHFFCSIKREKEGQNLSLTGKVAFFFKTLCLQQPHKSSKNAFISSKVTAKRACGPFSFVPWCLSHSMIRWKMGQKHLESWNQLFLEMLVCIDLLAPKEMVLSFAQ